MALSAVPAEIILGIIEHASPSDLAAVTLTCRRFYRAVRIHDKSICICLAIRFDIPMSEQERQSDSILVPLLVKRWKRMTAIETLLRAMEGNHEQNRCGLELLCEYRDATAQDQIDPSSCKSQQFLATKTAAQLTDLTTAIKFCSSRIFRVLQENQIDGNRAHIYSWMASFRQAASAEALIYNGVEAAAAILKDRERWKEVSDDWQWQQSRILPLLMKEQRHKASMEMVAAVALENGLGPVDAAQA